MKKLDDGRLRAGDIILTSGSNKVSKAVRRATNSAISHAMIYVQHSSVIDATAEGVHSSNIQRIFFEDESFVAVLRPRISLNPGCRPTPLHLAVSIAASAGGIELCCEGFTYRT